MQLKNDVKILDRAYILFSCDLSNFRRGAGGGLGHEFDNRTKSSIDIKVVA